MQREAAGFVESSRDLRLVRLVKNTKPRASAYWISTVRDDGLPSASTVESVAALGSMPPAAPASANHSRYRLIGSGTYLAEYIDIGGSGDRLIEKQKARSRAEQ